MTTPAEGIQFTVRAEGETPFEAMRRADRLARNVLSDWPTDWPIEFTNAGCVRVPYPLPVTWLVTLTGHAVDDTSGAVA